MAIAETAELIARLRLQDQMSGGLKKASSNVSRFEGGLGRAAGGLGKLQSGVVRAGNRIALAGLALGGAAAKIGIDFDDAFANVEKNVEGSTAEIDKLRDGLHALATRVPVSFQDLTDIAAEAGALGIATPDVIRFTETMARLSKATQGLTVEAASEAFGKFRNSLHLTQDEIDRSASALVTLGKTAGSSEGDIIEVAKRFAGAGAASKLSAAQILGLSSAIASLGVAPEAAGGSLSRLFNKVNLFIGTGDKKLRQFAKTAGMTSDAFAKGFRKDSLGTFQKFLAGLSKLSGPEQAKRLSAAGIVNVRDISALQLLAGSWQEVQKQTDAATKSFKENTDLTETSDKRMDTFRNNITLLGNNLKEIGFIVSEGMNPALERAAKKVTGFLNDPEFRKQAKQIGEDIGKAIDSIDWSEVIATAKGLAGAIKPALDIALSIAKTFNALPAEIKGASLAILAANKLSGGLILSGLGDVVGGLGESLAKSLAASIPIFGKAFVQPVFVTNPGFGAGGGSPVPGGIAPAVGAMGGLAVAATFGTAASLSTVGNALGTGIVNFINDAIPSPEPVKNQVREMMQTWFDNMLPNPGSIQRNLQNLIDEATGKNDKGHQPSFRDAHKAGTTGPMTGGPSSFSAAASRDNGFAKTIADGLKASQIIAQIRTAGDTFDRATSVAKTANVAALQAVGSNVTSGTSGTTGAVNAAAASIVTGFHSIPAPIVNVTTNVTASDVVKTVVSHDRQGPQPSRNGGSGNSGKNLPG